MKNTTLLNIILDCDIFSFNNEILFEYIDLKSINEVEL